MSEYLISLLPYSFWEYLFIGFFITGLLLTIFIIISASLTDIMHDGDVHTDIHTDIDTDIHTDIHTDFHTDMDTDVHTDFHTDMDTDVHTDFHTDMDTDFDVDQSNLDSLDIFSPDKKSDYVKSLEMKSSFRMGNVSIFILFFGQTGWIFIENLTDAVLLLALVVGYVTSKLFALVIEKYTKTVVNPITDIQRGDIAEVTGHSVSVNKTGMINVTRRDGFIVRAVAKGAFPHDNFVKGDKAYVLGKENSYYVISRGGAELNDREVVRNKKKSNQVHKYLQ